VVIAGKSALREVCLGGIQLARLRSASFDAAAAGWLAEPKLRSSEGWWARQGSNL
jgi:hypothetical protein